MSDEYSRRLQEEHSEAMAELQDIEDEEDRMAIIMRRHDLHEELKQARQDRDKEKIP